MKMSINIIIVLFLTFSVLKAKENGIIAAVKNVCFIISIFIMVLVLCGILIRVCHLLDLSVQTGCRRNIMSVLKNLFSLNIASAISLVIVAIYFSVFWFHVDGCALDFAWNFGPLVCLQCLLLSLLFVKMIAFDIWIPTTTSFIKDMNGLDYGTGMAYSYYYGYLRIMLPSTGTTTKGLQEKMENFEDMNNITFATHKLLILIPSSSYIPTDLKEASYQWMESIKHLEEEKRDRAGVKGRIYHNSAYKIYPGGYKSKTSPQYVLVEGATPIFTLFEVSKHSHAESHVYKMHHKEIVMSFYTKLQELLNNDPECRELCELIYYDDYDSKGVKVNVAQIILDRLSIIKRNA